MEPDAANSEVSANQLDDVEADEAETKGVKVALAVAAVDGCTDAAVDNDVDSVVRVVPPPADDVTAMAGVVIDDETDAVEASTQAYSRSR